MALLTVNRILSPKPILTIQAAEGKDAALNVVGARWNKRMNYWTMSANVASIYSMLRLYSASDIALDKQLLEDFKSASGFSLKPLPELSILRRLKSYQLEAVGMLTSSIFKGTLLCLAPGLGKTLTSIAAAKVLEARRVLIVCTVSLIPNWINEIHKWTGEHADNCYRGSPHPNSHNRWTVTNYNTATDFVASYIRPWDIVIIDESIQAKNRDADRSKALKVIAGQAPHRWLLSGSPISRYNDDLYSQFEIIYPEAFTSYWRFAKTYCIVEETQWGTKIKANRRSIDPRKEFRDLMFVRSHEDVKMQLPEVLYETIQVELLPEQRRLFNSLKAEFIAQLEDVEIQVTTKLAQLTRLQQVVSNPRNLGLEWPNISAKADVLIDLLKASEIPLPAIVWTHWKAGAEELVKRIRALKIFRVGYGSSGAGKGSDDIEAFKVGAFDILVMSLGVGKYGHTLTNAQSMVYVDKTWDADAYFQSIARVEGRIGLTHNPYVLTLSANKTTDDLINKNLAIKARNISEVSNASLAKLLRGLS